MKTKGYFLTILSAVILAYRFLLKITYSMSEQWNYNGLFRHLFCNIILF